MRLGSPLISASDHPLVCQVCVKEQLWPPLRLLPPQPWSAASDCCAGGPWGPEGEAALHRPSLPPTQKPTARPFSC